MGELIENQTIGNVSNIIAAEGGQSWMKYRTMFEPSFQDVKLSKYFGKDMNNLVGKAMKKIEEHVENGTVLNVTKLMNRLTLDVIGHVGFGLNHLDCINNESEELPELSRLNLIAGQSLIIFPRWFIRCLSWFIPHFRKVQYLLEKWPKYMRELVMNKKRDLQSELQSNHQDDMENDENFISQMLREESEEFGKLTIDEVMSNSHAILLAGNDTTGNCINYCFYHLVMNPHVQEKMKMEIDEFTATYRKNQPLNVLRLTFDEFESNFPYIKLVLHETLRMNSPVSAIWRRARKTITLHDGVVIPRGTFVAFMLAMRNTNREFWGDDSFQFRPERFQEHPEVLNPQTNADRFLFTPFSIGSRKCLGQKFSMMEMVLTLVNVLQRYRLEKAFEGEIQEKTTFTAHTERDVLIRCIPWGK